MGGLAYDFDTTFLPQLSRNWHDILFDSGNFSNNPLLQELWQGIIPIDPATGTNVADIIIRGSRFCNDWYYVWGSYRATFLDLRNDGNNVVAWDGFVTMLPAHALYSRFSENFVGGQENFNDPNIFNESNVFYSIPCRLPFALNPGPIADNAAIAADSEVGVHTLDYALGVGVAARSAPIPSNPARFVSDDPSTSACLNFTWMGHQRTVAANGTLDMDYVGCGGTYTVNVILPTYASEGGPSTPENLDIVNTERWGWGLTQALCRNAGGLPALALPDAYPKVVGISKLEERTAAYLPQGFGIGGINTDDIADCLLSNFATPAATTSGYYVSRIYDSYSYQGQDFANSGLTLICGEASRINAAGTAVAGTVPFAGVFASAFSTTVEYDYPASTPSDRAVLKIAVPPNFVTDTSIAAYDYEGAWANVISPSLSRVLIQESLFNGIPPGFLIGINNLDIGGVKTCAILGSVTQDVVYGGGYATFTALGALGDTFFASPLAIKGNQFTTQTGIALPEGTGAKWTGRVQQQATFSPEYEAITKNQALYESFIAGDLPPDQYFGWISDPDLLRDLEGDTTISPEDRDVSSLVGCSPTISFGPNFVPAFLFGTGNIYIGGLSNKPIPTEANPYSNLGYGLLAYVPGGEPYVFMYDYGTVSVIANTFGVVAPAIPPVAVRASGIQEGDNMNAAFTVAPTSTTRYPVSASWDNDRDQWTFTFADATNGFGFMSVNSAFSTAENLNQFSFLDQTDNFALSGPYAALATPQASIYTSRMMTPILDGLAILGASEDVTYKGQTAMRAFEYTPAGLGQSVNAFACYTINGTTGRTANVWVDYLLFDGVDSLIATELQTMGLRVTVENVEWYKAKIIRKGELGFTPEEVEDWVRSQQEEYKATQRLKQRQGRSRLRKRQVQAWQEGNNDMEDIVSGDFTEKGGFESLKEFDAAAADYVPPPEESSPDSSRKEKNKSGKR